MNINTRYFALVFVLAVAALTESRGQKPAGGNLELHQDGIAGRCLDIVDDGVRVQRRQNVHR